MPGTERAPGLVWRKRRNGPQVPYWIARTDLVRAGYRPKSVRLHYEDAEALAARCYVLQAEMLNWSVENRRGPAIRYDGTFASLVRYYETHPDSPYHDLHHESRRSYSKTMALLMKHKGARRIDAVDGADIRRWYKELCESHSKGWAYLTINVLKAYLSFGATKRIEECKTLRAELREARFGAGRRRKEQITYEQVVMVRKGAAELDMEWLGRCVTLQFAFAMRRRDVIGEYVKAEPGAAGIRFGRRIWRDGLTWNHIDQHGILNKLVSKTAFTSEVVAVHAIADYPDLVVELAKTPADKRVGPLVIHHNTGVPPTEAQCRAAFRLVARHVGIPDTIWMMDARAGANTEAFKAGADQNERMALLTHTERKTNERYIRDLTEPSRRAAAKRVGSRKE